MPQNILAFFETYADFYNRALAGEDVYDDIMNCFTEEFIAAGPGSVTTGKQGVTFRQTLDKGYRFYREIGAKKMRAQRVEVTRIDPAHAMAKVFYKADYVRKDGSPVSIDFDLVYFLDISGPRPKIFGFVAGDEMQVYRDYGLLPSD